MIQTSRKQVLAAFNMKESDPTLSNNHIAKTLGIFTGTVRWWFLNPATFDPYYDAIAIRRAMAGDGEVFDRLTSFEYRLVVALLERADTDEEPASNRFPFEHREKVRKAIMKRRKRVEHPTPTRAPRRKHDRIAATKLTAETCARAKTLRQKGIDFAVIADTLGISRSSVFRALSRAA